MNNSRTNRLLARTYFEVHTGVSHFSVIKSKWYWWLVTTRQPCLKHQHLFSCYITTYRNVIESYRHDFGILEFLFNVFTRLFPADWLFIIDHTIWLRWRICDQFLWTCVDFHWPLWILLIHSQRLRNKMIFNILCPFFKLWKIHSSLTYQTGYIFALMVINYISLNH